MYKSNQKINFSFFSFLIFRKNIQESSTSARNQRRIDINGCDQTTKSKKKVDLGNNRRFI